MVAGIASKVQRIWSRREQPKIVHPPRRRLVLPGDPEVVYAIGDVHGCLGKLLALEDRIVADGAGIAGLKLIIMLGDYIDRGLESAGVLEHLIRPPPKGFRRVSLCGNHEDVFVRFLRGAIPFEAWMEFGAEETLLSYGLDRSGLEARGRKGRHLLLQDVRAALPAEHVAFLETLPVAVSTPSCFFTHAGVRPGITLEGQSERDLLWIRDDFLASQTPFSKLVIHGHTPSREPTFVHGRLGVDTGAYMGGSLTAARLWRRQISFLTA